MSFIFEKNLKKSKTCYFKKNIKNILKIKKKNNNKTKVS